MKKVYTRVPSHGDIDTKHDTSNLIAAAAEAEHHGGDGVKPIAIASRQAFDAAQIKFVHALIDKLVAEGRVEECVSKWSSPIRVFRDGADTLMAVDYANTVNAHTAGRHSRWPQIRETLQDARWRIGEHGMQWGNALADAEVAAVLAFSVPHRTAPFTWKFVPHGVAFRPLIPDFRNFIVYAAPSTDPDNDPDDAGGGVESGGDVECAVTNCIVSEHSAKLLLKAKDINTIKPPLSEDIEAINQESTSTINQESTSTFAKLPAAKQKKKPLTKFKAKDFNASRNACAHKFGMQDPTQSAETAVRRWFNSFDNETLLDECRKHKEVAVASIAPLIYNAAITVNIPAVSRASKIILTFVQHDFVTAADIFSRW
ncbi:hypothetical protein HDU82_005715 [Entophlyctis luteolus]|nr:hypothetical protein HDU82_005715 [Entophlyctis luteolus]